MPLMTQVVGLQSRPKWPYRNTRGHVNERVLEWVERFTLRPARSNGIDEPLKTGFDLL